MDLTIHRELSEAGNVWTPEKFPLQEGVRLKGTEYFRLKNVRKREYASFRVIVSYLYRTIRILSSKLLPRNRIGYKITVLVNREAGCGLKIACMFSWLRRGYK